MFERGFGSDNHASVHPKIMNSLTLANHQHAPSYGTDVWSEKLQAHLKTLFGPQTEGFLVFNGTAANVLALRALVKPFERVLCGDISHLMLDECGAPEFFCGAKVQPLPTDSHGKLSLDTLKRAMTRRGDQHFSQARVISLTQPTELGQVYRPEEIREICDWAHSEGLLVHIDGARFASAAHYLQLSLKQASSDLGVDVLSFGGTKNGLMFGELVLFFNPFLANSFKYIRKQSAQLPSKTRFLAAQFMTYFEGELWRDLAKASCEATLSLFDELRHFPQIEIRSPPQANSLFVKFPRPLMKRLRDRYFFYVWDEATFECRIMTSWDTEATEISGFVDIIRDYFKNEVL